MTTNTKEAASLLIDAMALLERCLAGSTSSPPMKRRDTEDLIWAAHSHVQRAWGLTAGHEPTSLTDRAQEVIATVHVDAAIAEAARKD